jgi:hypothetical protein
MRWPHKDPLPCRGGRFLQWNQWLIIERDRAFVRALGKDRSRAPWSGKLHRDTLDSEGGTRRVRTADRGPGPTVFPRRQRQGLGRLGAGADACGVCRSAFRYALDEPLRFADRALLPNLPVGRSRKALSVPEKGQLARLCGETSRHGRSQPVTLRGPAESAEAFARQSESSEKTRQAAEAAAGIRASKCRRPGTLTRVRGESAC